MLQYGLMALSSPRLLPFLALAAALGSCAEPDPSYGDPGGILGKKVPNESGSGSSSSSSSGGDDAPFPSAYSGTANPAVKSVVSAHAAAVAAGKAAPSSISAPLVCDSCHKEGQAAAAKILAIGGRVMKGEAGIPNVDVIVTGPATVGPVKSDADGFFFALGTPIGAGSKVAIRSQAGKSVMSSTPQASCDTNGCHQESGQGRVGKGLP